nr:uncharacterized protein LOC120362715 [Saimiri boliviensis boliviensis]
MGWRRRIIPPVGSIDFEGRLILGAKPLLFNDPALTSALSWPLRAPEHAQSSTSPSPLDYVSQDAPRTSSSASLPFPHPRLRFYTLSSRPLWVAVVAMIRSHSWPLLPMLPSSNPYVDVCKLLGDNRRQYRLPDRACPPPRFPQFSTVLPEISRVLHQSRPSLELRRPTSPWQRSAGMGLLLPFCYFLDRKMEKGLAPCFPDVVGRVLRVPPQAVADHDVLVAHMGTLPTGDSFPSPFLLKTLGGQSESVWRQLKVSGQDDTLVKRKGVHSEVSNHHCLLWQRQHGKRGQEAAIVGTVVAARAEQNEESSWRCMVQGGGMKTVPYPQVSGKTPFGEIGLHQHARRDQNSIALHMKLEVLQRFEESEKLTQIDRARGLVRSTVASIRVNKDKVQANSRSPSSECCAADLLLGVVTGHMERLLSLWIGEQKQQNLPVSTLLIQDKACWLFVQLQQEQSDGAQAESFGASKGC